MVRYFYLRDTNKFPIAVIASDIIETGQERPLCFYALAIFNPKDKFDREMGKKIALARLEKKNVSSSYYGACLGGPGVKRRIATIIAGESTLPKRIRQAAMEFVNSPLFRLQ